MYILKLSPKCILIWIFIDFVLVVNLSSLIGGFVGGPTTTLNHKYNLSQQSLSQVD